MSEKFERMRKEVRLRQHTAGECWPATVELMEQVASLTAENERLQAALQAEADAAERTHQALSQAVLELQAEIEWLTADNAALPRAVDCCPRSDAPPTAAGGMQRSGLVPTFVVTQLNDAAACQRTAVRPQGGPASVDGSKILRLGPACTRWCEHPAGAGRRVRSRE